MLLNQSRPFSPHANKIHENMDTASYYKYEMASVEIGGFKPTNFYVHSRWIGWVGLQCRCKCTPKRKFASLVWNQIQIFSVVQHFAPVPVLSELSFLPYKVLDKLTK